MKTRGYLLKSPDGKFIIPRLPGQAWTQYLDKVSTLLDIQNRVEAEMRAKGYTAVWVQVEELEELPDDPGKAAK